MVKVLLGGLKWQWPNLGGVIFIFAIFFKSNKKYYFLNLKVCNMFHLNPKRL